MNCLEFRRRVLTEPASPGADAIAHRQNCSACRQFDQQIRDLDRGVSEAFNVDVPEGLAARVLLNRSLNDRKRLSAQFRRVGIAASILIIVSIALFQQPWTTTQRFDQAVLAHIENEVDVVRDMTQPGAPPIEESMVRKVLQQVQADSRNPLTNVVFAENCIIDGKLIAHFVVEDANTQYTVILVPWQDLDQEISIASEQWRGVIMPHETGSLAVIANAGQRDADSVNRIINRYRQSITRQDA